MPILISTNGGFTIRFYSGGIPFPGLTAGRIDRRFNNSAVHTCTSSFRVGEERRYHQECPILLGKFSRMRNHSISKTATAELGWTRLACSSINTCAVAQRAETRSQQPALKLRLKLLLVDQLAKKTRKLIVEFVTTKRLVCKNGHSLVEPPSRVFYTVSVSACLFVGERFFQKVYGRPLPSSSPFTLFAR